MTKSNEDAGKVQVVVRVRPFNKREKGLGAQCVVEMTKSQTTLYHTINGKPADDKKSSAPKVFTFDRCFWSMEPSNPQFSGQQEVYDTVGISLLDNAFQGYNACIFAYGQTGSGKSYSMMGAPSEPGLIPRLCQALFDRIDEETGLSKSFNVEVSFLEIYNEKVRDLLDPSASKNNLKVREHKATGPYVEGLSKLAATSASKIEEYISDGTKSRTVAATKMNAESSRSHAVFTVEMKQTITDLKTGVAGDRVSKISLVDLAGSERSSKTGATGARLKEGSNINKSLTTLGLVISALAEKESKKKKGAKHIPYRDSILTWILKDNLGGNSRTTMVATISPSEDNYDETLSTLRYADRAKQIVNSAVVNEDENARVVRELQEEVERLKQELKESQSKAAAPEIQEKLKEYEHLKEEMTRSWEEKIRQSEEIHKKKQETFTRMGISVESSGLKIEKDKCFFLVNLNSDPQMNEMLIYYLKEDTSVGQCESSDLKFYGLGIADNHARVTIDKEDNTVTVTPFPGARTCVNGQQIYEATRIKNGDRILWGNNYYFRVHVPKPVKPRQPKRLTLAPAASLNDQGSVESLNDQSIADTTLNETISYGMALEEVILNQDGAVASIQETIGSLEREFNMIEHHSKHDKGGGGAGDGGDGTNILHHLASTPLHNDVGSEERKKYQQEIQALREKLEMMSPSNSSSQLAHSASMPSSLNHDHSSHNTSASPASSSYHHPNYKPDRERAFNQSLERLRKDLMHAQALVQEANALSKEMRRKTEFAVTLRIPAKNLTPNRPEGALMCEPAIQVVRQGKDLQTWCCETLSNRLFDMREMYDQFKQYLACNSDDADSVDVWMRNTEFNSSNDPFNEIDNRQSVIGVANVFLACLLQDEPLTYPVPIINQHGQVAGKLTVSIQRLKNSGGGNAADHDDEEGSKKVTLLKDEEDGLIQQQTIMRSSSNHDDSIICHTTAPQTPNPVPPAVAEASSVSSACAVSSDDDDVIDDVTVEGGRKRRRRGGERMTCRIRVVEAQGLMPTLSHFVQCQYQFPGRDETTVVPPQLSPDEISPTHQSSLSVRFDHTCDFETWIDDDFIESMQSNYSLAIEVWGHRNRYTSGTAPSATTTSPASSASSSSNKPKPPSSTHTTNVTSASHPRRRTRSRESANPNHHSALHHHNPQLLKSHMSHTRHAEIEESLQERWSEVIKRLRLDVRILELTDSGEYEPVEVQHGSSSSSSSRSNNSSCGCFLLKQGQSRRLEVKVHPIENSGSLPLLCETVASVLAGSITSTQSDQKQTGMDSYQERDMKYLADEWLDALERRKTHLTNQIAEITKKDAKTALEVERENALFDQWMKLQGEMTAAHTGGAGIPGSPNDNWKPPEGVEAHVPVLYLDLNPEEVDNYDIMRVPAGLDSELCGEMPGTFVNLQFVRPPCASLEGIVSGLVSWDSSIHDTPLLNRVTPSNEEIYVIIRVHVRLSHPASMDLVLRKRIRVSVYRQKSSFGSTLFRKMSAKPPSSSSGWKSGVIYEIVSNLPMASSDGDDQETLALMAATNAQLDNSQSDEDANNASSTGNMDGEESTTTTATITSHHHHQQQQQVTSSSFERYVMHASRSVDNILALDRLKQEMALREVLLQNHHNRPIASTADVISVISRRYKTNNNNAAAAQRASSVYSGFPPHEQ